MGAASSVSSDLLLPISPQEAHAAYGNKSQLLPELLCCPHPYCYYLHDFDVFNCCDCQQKITEPIARMEEQRLMEGTYDDDRLLGGMRPGEYSAKNCGIKLGFLKKFVEIYNCEDWSAADIIRYIIKPATQQTRCRAAELPCLREYVGPSQTFISYAQQGVFGDVVAGLLDGGVVDLDRFVWIDVFGIRQWPSRDQKKELDFANTIANCKSFISICSVHDLDMINNLQWKDYYLKKFEIPKNVGQKICFLRVWCLVEAFQCSITPGMPFILKAGRYRKNEITGELEFETMPNLNRLQHLVDIERAEASVEKDKRMILEMVEGKGGGIAHLNGRIMGAISGAYSAMLLNGPSDYAVPSAACGDVKAKEIVMRDESSIFCTAANGFTTLLYEMIKMGSFDMHAHDVEFGGTCLVWAAYGAHSDTSKLLLDSCLPDQDKLESYLNATSNHGRSALLAAAKYGHSQYIDFLITYAREKDVDIYINAGDNHCHTAVMFCCIGGHYDALKVLLQAGADVNLTDLNGSTALIKAVCLGHVSCVSLLLDANADPAMKDDNGITALEKQMIEGVKTESYNECVNLVRNKYLSMAGKGLQLGHVAVALQAQEGIVRKNSAIHEYTEPSAKKDRRATQRHDSYKKRMSVLQHAVKNRNIDTKLLADPILNKRITRMQAKIRGFIGRKAVYKLILALKFTNKTGNFSHRGSFYKSEVGANILRSASMDVLPLSTKSKLDKPRPKPLMY